MHDRLDALDLGGRWRIRPDPRDVGLSERWWTTRFDGPAAEIALPSSWHEVVGVGCAIAWLQREVELPDGWRGPDGARPRVDLHLEAVATECRAWIDDAPIGLHRGDYVPFRLTIGAMPAGRGPVRLTLRVDRMAAAAPPSPGALQRGHITKGFHDVLSLAHGGVWQPLRLERAGRRRPLPGGVSVTGDARGRALVTVDLEAGESCGTVAATLADPGGRVVARAVVDAVPPARRVELPLRVDGVRPWSPDDPSLYDALVEWRDEAGAVETFAQRVGFRTIEADGRTIRLNGAPIFLRGVLHWGHEPRHGAPAPTPAQARDELAHLRGLGFNLVCLCMWYPPEHYFEVAAELGVLLWQEHPVWQSSMRERDLPEYRRLYEAFLRRDRRHPAVVIVSATCEHPSFHPALARWWWATARRELPDRLLQVQTAFFRWSSGGPTDLHDEHVYDNNNRWIDYVADVQAHLEDLPPRPFVMGETVLFTSWPDVPALRARCGDDRPWWLPRAFDAMLELETTLERDHGPGARERLRADGDRFNILGRRFQVERFRRFAGNAGLVMNHLRDVPACQCGFMDDLDRWRFEPAQTRPWLADRAIILDTPDHRRGVAAPRGAGDRALACTVAVANFTGAGFRGAVRGRVEQDGRTRTVASAAIACAPGAVGDAPLTIPVAPVAAPARVRVTLDADGAATTSYDLWAFPQHDGGWPEGVVRFGGLPYERADAAPDDVERAYSRGYGLDVRRHDIRLPDPTRLAPSMPSWSAGPVPPGARVVLTHRLTREIAAYIVAGGRAVVLASKAPGGIGATYESLYGQVPLVVERGPLRPGDRAWLIDMLVVDLARQYCRVMPTEALGVADDVDPLVRLIFTHDQPPVRVADLLWRARVGRGLLVASSLDHGGAAGAYVLRRIVDHLAAPDVRPPARALDTAQLEAWTHRTSGAGP